MTGFRQINYVATVAREGSFTLASERLHVSQSAISEQVKLLEDRLGFQIFERTGRGVRVTRKGQIYLHEAEKLIANFHRLGDLAKNLGKSGKDLVRVGMISGISRKIIPRLENIAQGYKTPQFNITIKTTRDIYFALANLDLDIGFAVQSRSDMVPSGLEECELFSTELVFIAPEKSWFAASDEPVDLQDVVELPFIVGELSVGYGLATVNAFDLLGTQLNIVSIVDNIETVKMMVTWGYGYALVPETCIQSADRQNGLSIHRLAQSTPVTVSAYYLRTNAHNFDLSVLSEENGEQPATV